MGTRGSLCHDGVVRRVLALMVALTACGGRGGEGEEVASPRVVARGVPLPSPAPIAPNARGAAFLGTLAGHIQPRWSQFLEDCRLRLGADHPLNMASLTADLEIVLAGETGKLVEVRVIQTSGNSDFDGAAREILNELPATPPPAALESDDGRVHVHWVFARDRRQAGAATATIMAIELPLVTTVQRLLERGAIARAAQRLVGVTGGESATELVMIAALREGLASSDGSTREAALEAVTRTKLAALASDVHGLIEEDGQQRQRVLAITASAALGDKRVVPALVAGLAQDLETRPEIALAKIAALVALEERAAAAKAIAQPRKHASATAVAALALVPDPALAPALGTWLARGDAEMRQAVCAALPAAAPAQAAAVIARGLRDADASVRANCVLAAARGNTNLARLGELARDRDEAVRARAVAALATREPVRRQALQDRSPRVRAAAAAGANELDLRTLAADKDPDVRAAAVASALARFPERAADLARTAAGDAAAVVRRAAVPGLSDDARLEQLAGDDDPDVATAALGRYAQRRGRAAVTAALLQRLAAATPKSLERVRIARAWLLAR